MLAVVWVGYGRECVVGEPWVGIIWWEREALAVPARLALTSLADYHL